MLESLQSSIEYHIAKLSDIWCPRKIYPKYHFVDEVRVFICLCVNGYLNIIHTHHKLTYVNVGLDVVAGLWNELVTVSKLQGTC